MTTITGREMVKEIQQKGSVAILPRQREDFQWKTALEGLPFAYVGATFGIHTPLEDLPRLPQIIFYVLELAHADLALAEKKIREFKAQSEYLLMVGNIVTDDAANRLISAGADAVKVGIGGGSVCTTRLVSGVGVPQFTALKNVCEFVRSCYPNVTVISDGGIRHLGDIVKALACGADAVMSGYLFAGTKEAAAPTVSLPDGSLVKNYAGEASAQIKRNNGDSTLPEGVSQGVPYSGEGVGDVLWRVHRAIQTGMAYCGAKSLTELRKCATFVRVSRAAQREARPHVF